VGGGRAQQLVVVNSRWELGEITKIHSLVPKKKAKKTSWGGVHPKEIEAVGTGKHKQMESRDYWKED